MVKIVFNKNHNNKIIMQRISEINITQGLVSCDICQIKHERMTYWRADNGKTSTMDYCQTCFQFLENRLKLLGWIIKKEDHYNEKTNY